MEDPERWARVGELFDRVVDAPEAEWSALLDAGCAGDADLRAQVEAMLRAHRSEARLLDAGWESLLPVLADDVSPAADRRIGAFRLVRELGRGGMGVVFLAEREAADFQQTVAVKCLLPGYATEDLAERFARERRILARLAHPAIAQLHDGGMTETGQPYLVMEYVDGERLDRYCDARRLDVDARLRLFVAICEAVQYAHQHFVVHRDLKPGNVLVTSDGHVKLLDFGIAKLVHSEAGEDAALTQQTQVLTPEYASPEQVLGEPVGAASDVFSLGLIAFELLTGRRAFKAAGTGPLDRLHAVLRQEPARASAVAAGASDAAQRAAARSTTPERLSRRLRGDLDTILERALRREPSERYPSAQALLEDVQRHLDGLPIRARSAGRVYRLVKFARRHRAALAGTVAATLALLAGLGAALWQAGVAARERDAARAEARTAERVTEFLVEVFRSVDPAEAQGESLTAREILDRGARTVELELAEEPVVRARVQRAIGRVYGNLAEFEPARRLIERSIETDRELFGDDHLEVADGLAALAAIASNVDLGSDSLYRRVLDIRRRQLAPDDPRIADALHGLAISVSNPDFAAADSLLHQAIAILERHPDHRLDLANSLTTLGVVNQVRGGYAAADSLYRRALEIQLQVAGEEHPATLATMSNLGWLQLVAGRLDAADSILRRTVEVRRRVLGDRHLGLAPSLHGLGEVAYRRGDYGEAERLLTEALEIRRESGGTRGSVFPDNLQMLASVLSAAGRLEEADARFDEAIASLEENGHANDLVMARAINNRGSMYENAGDYARATAAYRQAHDIYRARLGDEHAFTAIVLSNIGVMLLLRDSVDAAEPLLRSALATLEKAYSPEHTTVGNVLVQIGTIELRTGRLAEAETTLRRALAILQKNLPPSHWRLAQARLRLATVLGATGRGSEAEPLLLAAWATLEGMAKQRPNDYREALDLLVALYESLGRSGDAARFRALAGASF